MRLSKDTPRYLFLIPGLDPRQGGIQVSAIDALKGIAVDDESACIVYGSDPENCIPNKEKSICVPGKLKLIARLCLRRWPCKVAVFWHLGMLKLLPIMRGFNGRKIVFLHGIECWRKHPDSIVRQLKDVDLFLSNSDYTWHRFLEFLPSLKSIPHQTIPLGFGAPLGPENLVPFQRPMALMIGRLLKSEDYKGHRQMIAAWPAVLKVIPNAKLEIVGEGDLRTDLERMVASLAMEKHVVFHGRVDEAKKNELLEQCSLMALPSKGEGFGIVYLEAMRYGRPCLVSDCDAGQEVTNRSEAGISVSQDSIESISSELVEILGGGTRWQKLSMTARLRYEKNYTVTAFRNRLFSAIENVL